MGSSPVTLFACVFPMELGPLMISISFYLCNCLYSLRWAEGLKHFPKNFSRKKKIVFESPALQEEGKGQGANYQQHLVNLWFPKRNLFRVAEVVFCERSLFRSMTVGADQR